MPSFQPTIHLFITAAGCPAFHSQETFLFDWADLPLPQFCLRLGTVWAAFLITLGLPVSVVTFDLLTQPAECLVAASTGSLFLVTVLVLRLYLGYNHVGSRLLSATVEYEVRMPVLYGSNVLVLVLRARGQRRERQLRFLG